MEIRSSDWVILSSRRLLRLPSRGIKWPVGYTVEGGRQVPPFYNIRDIQGRGAGRGDELSFC